MYRLMLFQSPSRTALKPQLPPLHIPNTLLARGFARAHLLEMHSPPGALQGEQSRRWSQLLPPQIHHVPHGSAKLNFPGRVSRPDSRPVLLF